MSNMGITSIIRPSAPLRDIRPDLRDRLRSASAELEAVRSMTETLQKTVELLEAMLATEEVRFTQQETERAKRLPDEPLAEFLLRSMSGGQLRTKEDLRWMADQAGYEVDGRSIHATLVNLMKTNRAVEIGEGQFAAR